MPRLTRGAGILVLALLLAGCGAAGATGSSGSAGSGGSGATALACTMDSEAHPIDTITVVLNCVVTRAPADATSFTLHYTVQDSLGNPRTMGAPCEGSLTNGTGACTQTFSLPVPLDPAKGTVSGTLQPGGQKLGPVVPKQLPRIEGTPSVPLGG